MLYGIPLFLVTVVVSVHCEPREQVTVAEMAIEAHYFAVDSPSNAGPFCSSICRPFALLLFSDTPLHYELEREPDTEVHYNIP